MRDEQADDEKKNGDWNESASVLSEPKHQHAPDEKEGGDSADGGGDVE